MEPREQARKLYQESGGKKKLREIADEIGIALPTVKSWKQRDGWDEKADADAEMRKDASREKDASRKRRNASNREAAKHIENNGELTDAERDFCIQMFYAPNPTQAAVKTKRYKTYESAKDAGWRMMRNPAVQAEIARLKEIKRATALADIDDHIEFLKRAATTDITAIANITRGGFTLKKGSEFDGSIITEISKSKGGGLKIKRVDPLRAIELLCKIQGDFAPEKQQIEHTGGVALRAAKMSDEELDKELERLLPGGEGVLPNAADGEAKTAGEE